MDTIKFLSRMSVSLALVMSASVFAADNDAAFVVSLQGKAKVSGGRSFDLSPLTKLRLGEQVTLDKGSKLQIVYLANNRKEEWNGVSQLKIGVDKSESSGKPTSVSSIPAAITNQIVNTPDSTSTSRVGMVRLRATSEIKLQEIEKNYQNYKQTVGQNNTLAEVYKLGELYNLKEYDMMSEMISQIRADRPNDHAIAELAAKYMLLVDNAKTSQQ